MVGRCIPYWNSHCFGDMLVFKGVCVQPARTSFILGLKSSPVFLFSCEVRRTPKGRLNWRVWDCWRCYESEDLAVLPYWPGGWAEMGLDYIHHRPPQTYIFRGVDNVFFLWPKLLFFMGFSCVYIQKYVFSYFTRSLRDEERKMIWWDFTIRFASSWSLKKGLGFSTGKGLIHVRFQGWMAKLQAAVARGVNDIRVEAVGSGGCNGEKLASKRIFSTKKRSRERPSPQVSLLRSSPGFILLIY